MTGKNNRQRGAAALFRASIRIRHRLGNRTELTNSFSDLAQVLYQAGELKTAVQLVSACQKIRAEMGLATSPQHAAEQAKIIAAIRAALGDAAYEVSWVQGQTFTLDEAVRVALAG